MKLYTYWRSSCSWRVRIALHHKGLAFESCPVHLLRQGGEQRTPAYQQMNALAQVPALVLDDGAVITQSVAILEYLEEQHPTPPLLPGQPLLRARVREMTQIINSGIQPLHNLAVLQAVEKLGADKQVWGAEWVSRGLTALEQRAKGTADGCLVGHSVTWADVCLVPQLAAARRFPVDVEQWPTLLRVERYLSGLPAFVAAHAQQQPDAEV